MILLRGKCFLGSLRGGDVLIPEEFHYGSGKFWGGLVGEYVATGRFLRSPLRKNLSVNFDPILWGFALAVVADAGGGVAKN